jgi:hypothetical protein
MATLEQTIDEARTLSRAEKLKLRQVDQPGASAGFGD